MFVMCCPTAATHPPKIADQFVLEPYPGRYLAIVDDDVIVLDLERDEYAAAPPALGTLIRFAFDPSRNDQLDDPRVQRLIDENILIDSPTRSTPYVLPRPTDPGGLRNATWRPSGGAVIAHPADTTWVSVATATWLLYWAQRLIDRGIGSLVAQLRVLVARKPTATSSSTSLNSLVEAHIRARMIYPKFTQCLASATAFAAHAWRCGFDVDFVIGVQGRPFYAHAWVEQDGVVVNDPPEINRQLAPILRIGPATTDRRT
jgi:hypothetical protein